MAPQNVFESPIKQGQIISFAPLCTLFNQALREIAPVRNARSGFKQNWASSYGESSDKA